MMNQMVIKLLAVCLISGTTYAQAYLDSSGLYKDDLDKYRTGKNIKMAMSESTPLTPEQQRNFKGLNYFPANLTWIFEATLEPDPEPEIVLLRTSTERTPEYIRYGKVRFRLDSLELELSAYQNKKLLDVNPSDSILFIPFRDLTSGKESYPGGRYVDCILPKAGNKIILDFNRAYNPYCAYNLRFSCVIPPDENNLPIPIEAGEKLFEKH